MQFNAYIQKNSEHSCYYQKVLTISSKNVQLPRDIITFHNKC